MQPSKISHAVVGPMADLALEVGRVTPWRRPGGVALAVLAGTATELVHRHDRGALGKCLQQQSQQRQNVHSLSNVSVCAIAMHEMQL